MNQISHNQHQMQPVQEGQDLFLVPNATRRGRRLALLFMLMALTIGLFQIFKIKPKYSATAEVLVNQPGGDGVVTSHLAIIKSQAVLDDAIKADKLDNVTFKELYTHLTVTRLDRTLTIKFDSEDPAKPVKVVDAVIDAYKRFQERTFEKKKTGSGKGRFG